MTTFYILHFTSKVTSDPDPDPNQNDMDPKHWIKHRILFTVIVQV